MFFPMVRVYFVLFFVFMFSPFSGCNMCIFLFFLRSSRESFHLKERRRFVRLWPSEGSFEGHTCRVKAELWSEAADVSSLSGCNCNNLPNACLCLSHESWTEAASPEGKPPSADTNSLPRGPTWKNPVHSGSLPSEAELIWNESNRDDLLWSFTLTDWCHRVPK